MSMAWKSIHDAGLHDPYAAERIAKVRITTYIDHDVLAELKKRSKKKKYQTLLNELLRKVIFPKENK